MKESPKIIENNENLDNKTLELVIGADFKNRVFDKKNLYNVIQAEWSKIVEQENLFPEKISKLEGLDAIKEICSEISKTKSGFGTSPGLHKSLDEKSNGLDCVSASMVLATYLEENKINFSYISPVNHVALFVELEDKTYYVDPRNDKVVDITNYIKNTEELDGFDKVNFKTKPEDKIYSFVFKYKNKEDIVRAILGNIFVLDQLNKGDDSNASLTLDAHKQAAKSISGDLLEINWTKLDNYIDSYPDYHESNKEILEEENLRLKKVGFYE